jgi:hypothetical protein
MQVRQQLQETKHRKEESMRQTKKQTNTTRIGIKAIQKTTTTIRTTTIQTTKENPPTRTKTTKEEIKQE